MFAYMLVALLSQVVRTPGGICQSGTEMGSTSFRFYWKLFDHIDIIASKDKRCTTSVHVMTTKLLAQENPGQVSTRKTNQIQQYLKGLL